MFPPEFDYRRPESVAAALDALAADDAVPLAGGHSLVPDLKARRRSPGTLVDLSGLDDLRGVKADDDELVVGALTTYADLLAADPTGVDAFAEATRAVGDRQIRNCGTVGGNLAAADPRGDLPAAALAADASMEVRGQDGDERTVPADEFLLGDGETACGDDELLAEVRLPTAATSTTAEDATIGGAYAKKTHPAEGYAAVGVAARVAVAGDEVVAARVAVNGVFEHARRLQPVESVVAGRDVEDVTAGDDSGVGDSDDGVEVVADAASALTADLDPAAVRSDHLVSGEYRLRLLPAYATRAVASAVERATGGSVADEEVVA